MIKEFKAFILRNVSVSAMKSSQVNYQILALEKWIFP